MEIKSNMPGTIVEIMVSVGDDVDSGQDVVCLESMKMQMFISADEVGKVTEIKVEPGDFVNEGDTLLVID